MKVSNFIGTNASSSQEIRKSALWLYVCRTFFYTNRGLVFIIRLDKMFARFFKQLAFPTFSFVVYFWQIACCYGAASRVNWKKRREDGCFVGSKVHFYSPFVLCILSKLKQFAVLICVQLWHRSRKTAQEWFIMFENSIKNLEYVLFYDRLEVSESTFEGWRPRNGPGNSRRDGLKPQGCC